MAPWSKELGPLGKAIKAGDVLKKKVDATVKESNKLIGNKKAKDKDELIRQMYQNCIDTKTLIENHTELVENLKEEEEPNKIKDFEKKKTAEQNRCITMKTQISETMSKLLPDMTEAEFLKSREEATEEKEKDESADDKGREEEDEEVEEEEDEEVEEEEDEEEEEEEEEEDEEEDEEESTADQSKLKVPPLNKTVTAKEDEDEDDDEEDEEDDEEESEEDREETGPQKPVQAKRLKKAAKEEEEDYDEEEEDEEEEDEDEEEEEDEDEEEEEEEKDYKKEAKKKSKDKKKDKKDATLEVTQSTHRFTTVDDYEGEEGDLNFTKGDILTVLETRDDGWWLAENDAGERGLVPSTYLQKLPGAEQDDDDDEEEEEDEDEEADDSLKPSKGKKLWGSLKTALAEQQTTVSDVLHAMGAVPSGFRPSTLWRKFNEGDTFRLSSYLSPKLSQSNLAYRDLFFSPSTNKIRPRSTRIERVITLVSGVQIPLPGIGIEVLDRHVRMCLFDGNHILSNIHTVKVGSVDKSQRSWAFSTKVSEQMDPYSHAEIFVRTNDTMDNIGLLCELCVTYARASSKEKGVFSCGWALMPLLDENRAVVQNKTFDLQVNGGTPYEKGVEVDPSIGRRTTSKGLASLISGNKQPRLSVRVSLPNKQHKELMDTMPDTIVGNVCMLQLMSHYRQCLCDVLLRDRLDLTSTELIHSPVLKGFPQTADVPDLMKLLRTSWHEKLRDVKRNERFVIVHRNQRDEEFMKELFRQVYLDTVYPVSQLASMPAYREGDHDNWMLRSEHMKRFTEMRNAGKGALAVLLSPDMQWQPMYLDEMAFNIIGPHCLPRAIMAES